MPFDLDKNEPVRFYFDKDQVEWVELRIADDDDLRTIRDRLGIKAVMTYVPNPAKDNVLEMVPATVNTDQLDEFTRELNYFGIPSWRLIDGSGNEISHSKENVDLMIRRSKRFSTFVQKNLKKLREDRDAELEAEIKN